MTTSRVMVGNNNKVRPYMLRYVYLFIFTLGVSLFLQSCIETVNNYDKLPNGTWRGVLVIENKSFTTDEDDEEVLLGVNELNESELPFNFDISYDKNGEMQATIINGEERIELSEILYGRNNSIAKDTFRFVFPEFDSYIKGAYEDNSINGEFVITSKDNYTIPFHASYGQEYRFTALKKEPLTDLTGIWECTFEEGKKDEYKALGDFKQDGNKLTGTFQTETGDYRFLEGTVQANKAYLSVFDGTHAFLFAMKLVDQDNIVGSFRSGNTYKSTWTAKRNADFKLTNPSKLTYLTEENPSFDFEFSNPKGEMIGLENEIFKDKIKVISIMGTWCPNCKDEMIFLKDIQEKYKDDVQVLAVAFERYKNQEKAFEAINRYSKVMDLNFPMVHGGLASKTLASETFPMLNKIISFPTIMVLDRNNKVQYIHTGFNGPATSMYKEFVEEFNQKLKSID